MKIPSIITNSATSLLSGLSNNSDSIIPMTVKDTISNALIVKTYKKNGGKDDARERAIEEFGTGAVWLFGIPAVKKLMDLTVYPILKLNPNFDIRILKDKNKLDSAVSGCNEALKTNLQSETVKKMAGVLNGLNDKNEVLKNFSNKNLYKSLFLSKFAISTVLSAFALTKIIKYKQKTTQKRIEKEISENLTSRTTLDKSVKNSNVYSIFTGAQNKNISFTGALDFFMYNPIANTSILDGVITTTRLKEARKGEKKEVALKEIFQILFIYAIAKPTQMAFEAFGKKAKIPIELDPKVLFSKNAKDEINKASEFIKSSGLQDLKDNELTAKIYEIATKDINNPLLNILNKNGNISIIEKNGEKAFDFLKNIEGKDLKKTIDNVVELDKNASKSLGKIKAYKAFSVFANIAIGAFAMGVVQPLVNIGMRKLLNNGDHRNPAIVAQEKELQFKAVQTKLQ